MKTITLLLAFSLCACAQSFHIIRVTPLSTTPGSALFCGDTSHQTTCVTGAANSAGTTLTVDKSAIIGTADNTFFAVDAGGSSRLGFTKQSAVIPRLTYGSGISFQVAQSNASDIGAGNTFTPHLSLDGITGAPTFTFNSATTGAVFTQSGAGSVITVAVTNASPAISLVNGSGPGMVASSSSGIGITGSGVTGLSGLGNTGVLGSSLASGGMGGDFSSVGSFGVGIRASGTLQAAHFGTGNVQIDNQLAVSGTSAFGAQVAVSTTSALPAVFMVNSGSGFSLSVQGSSLFTLGPHVFGGFTTLQSGVESQGNITLNAEDHFLSVDAAGNTRLGFTKKTGSNPQVAFGSGIDFVIGQSSGTGIAASNTFTPKFKINASTGAVTIPQLAGAGSLPACLDSAGKLYAGTNTAGVLACP